MSQVHRPVRGHRGDDPAPLAIGQRLHEQVRVPAAHDLPCQYVGMRGLKPLRESRPLLRVCLVKTGNSQLLDELVFAGKRLVTGAHHQRRYRHVSLFGPGLRRVGVQYLPVQPAQALRDVVERPLLHLSRVGQQQPRNVLRRFRSKPQLARLATRAHEQVFLHRRLMDGVALQVLLRGHVPGRLDAGVGQLQDAVVAPRDDCPLLASVLRVGQAAGRHFGSHQRRVFTVQQPFHPTPYVRDLRQAPPIRGNQGRVLSVQPGHQPRQPRFVQLRRRRYRQPLAQTKRRRQAIAAVGGQVDFSCPACRWHVLKVVRVAFHTGQVQLRGVPKQPPVHVIAANSPCSQNCGARQRHKRLRRARSPQPGVGHRGGCFRPRRVVRPPSQVEQRRQVHGGRIRLRFVGQ